MRLEIPADFSAKTLNVEKDGTEIMKTIFANGRATVDDQLKESLDAMAQNSVPEADVIEIVKKQLNANINSTKHLMSDLGWTKREVKWGKADYGRQLWVRPGYTVQNGKISGPDGVEMSLAKHLDRFAQEIETI